MQHLHQFHHPALGHASYLVADPGSRRAFVLDPARDITPYLDAARHHGYEIAWAMDSHGHNDYLSGLAELVEATGARAIAPVGASVGYEAEFGRHGQRIELGPEVAIELLHTPGHTPEHTAVLVHGIDDTPVLLSGGSPLVGDVGRPDLLGSRRQRDRAADALAITMAAMFEQLPDRTLVLPTHVGGSMCATTIADALDTALGDQRTQNPSVRAILDHDGAGHAWLDADQLPPVPAFWPTSRRHNLAGVPARPLEPTEAAPTAIDSDWLVLDVRSADEVARTGTLPGAVNVPVDGSFSVWAGIVAHGADDVAVLATDEAQARQAHHALLDVHPWGVRAWLDARAIELTPTRGDRIDDPAALLELAARGARRLVDVRNPAETLARPIPGAEAIPAAGLLGAPDSAPREPLVVACASGYRAIVVASHLRAHGHDALALVGSPFDVTPTTAHVAGGRA